MSKNNYIFTPNRYFDFEEMVKDGVALAAKMQPFSATLAAQLHKTNELNDSIKLRLN